MQQSNPSTSLSPPSIGAHLWAFEKSGWEANLSTLLPALRAGGYAGFEAFLRVPATAASLKTLEMPLLAAHARPSLMEDWDAFAFRLDLLGTRDVCSSGLIEWNERTPDDYRRTANVLSGYGRRLRERGVFLHYHNHDFEFERWDGGLCGMDLLLKHLDPEAVTLCLDLGWLHVAGEDSVAWMRQHAPRIGYLHLRDFAGKTSVALGRGDVPLGAQVAAIATLPNVRHIVVEQDPDTATPLEDMLASRKFLRDVY